MAGSIGACFQGVFGGVGGVLVDPVTGGGGARGGLVLVVTFGLAEFRGYRRAVSCIVSCVCLLCRAEGFVMCCCLRFSFFVVAVFSPLGVYRWYSSVVGCSQFMY